MTMFKQILMRVISGVLASVLSLLILAALGIVTFAV